MGPFDILLFIVYGGLCFLLSSLAKIKDPLLRKWLRPGLALKISLCFSCALFSMYGDAFLYFSEGKHIISLVSEDISQAKILFGSWSDYVHSSAAKESSSFIYNESSFAIVRICALFSFLAFNNFFVVCLFFAMIAFSGAWKLFCFFYRQYPHLHWQLAAAFLCLPGFVFFSSVPGKEALVIGATGWLVYSLDQIFNVGKKIIAGFFLVIFTSLLIFVLNASLFWVLVPLVVLYFILSKGLPVKKRPLQLLIYFVFALVIFFSSLAPMVVKEQPVSFFQTTEPNFYFGGPANSMTDLLKMCPGAVEAALFRPYIWETRSYATFTGAVDSLLFLLLTIFAWAWVIKRSIRLQNFSVLSKIVKDRNIWFCLCFSLIYAALQGLTTLNFGSLTRYRSVIEPFYALAMILVIDKNRKTEPIDAIEENVELKTD